MKVLLDESLEEIKLFADLKILLTDFIGKGGNAGLLFDSSSSYKDPKNDGSSFDSFNIEKLYSMTHVNNPVKDFLEYTSKITNTGLWNDARLAYIHSALFNKKGSLQIFDVMNQTINSLYNSSDPTKDFWIDHEYLYPDLTVSINPLRIIGREDASVEEWVSKLMSAIYYLLYYDNLTVKITTLIISIIENITKYNFEYVVGFRYYESK